MTIPRDMQKSLATVGLAALVGSGVTGTGAVAIRNTEAGDLQATVRKSVREETALALEPYVTKDALANTREGDRERVEGKLDQIRSEVQRLALAVERLRR